MKSQENNGGLLLSYTNLKKAALVYIALPTFSFFKYFASDRRTSL